MSALDDGLGGFLVLFAVGFLAHEPWRWVGLYIGRSIDADGELFRWVRAVSNALVAALVARVVVFPAGALADIPLSLRLASVVAAFLVFHLAGRNLAIGIIGGCGALIAGKLLLS